MRLDGYRLQPVHTVEAVGFNHNKIVLLVVSPQADPDQAHAIMMTAAGPDNALTVDSLLQTSAEVGNSPTVRPPPRVCDVGESSESRSMSALALVKPALLRRPPPPPGPRGRRCGRRNIGLSAAAQRAGETSRPASPRPVSLTEP